MPGPFIQDRETSRRFFIEVWKKHRAGRPLEAMESLVRDIILEHPEYHSLLERDEDALAGEFTPDRGETNPFLHMGMHITLREQVATDRPPGIRAIYTRLLEKFSGQHNLEHRMMECLGEVLWTAQRNNSLPDETAYLESLKKIK
ncbi:MAG TPA: DUF1841 family protein [Gammaproteobacteria bacterium]|nr:DUF1841 family protein [Gammaproteobacteria bacterium]